MTHTLPPLPFERGALSPRISAETLELHHGRHHADYLKRLNSEISGTELEKLSLDSDGKLRVESTHDSANPVVHDLIPLLACDLWEHAYYVDYRNERKKFVEASWSLMNWGFAAQVLERVDQIRAA